MEAIPERVVFDGKLVTAAGVSAGIDMALTLVERIAGDELAQAIQLGIEYDPAAALRRGLAGEGAVRDRRGGARILALQRRTGGMTGAGTSS